jgi:hypothetical protein
VQFFKSLQLKSCTPGLPLLLLDTSVSVATSVVSDLPTNPMTGDCSVTAVAVVLAVLFTVLDVAALTGCTVGASAVAAVGAAAALLMQ